MSVQLDVQYACESQTGLPSVEDFQRWTDIALCEAGDAEVVIRLVDEAESRELNHQYRGKNKSTNVLSFPMELPDELVATVDEIMLGDLVICAPVVAREAAEQNKPLHAHWAHMVIHGMLHLQGYDHIADDEAAEMETLEIKLLQQLGMANPYGTDE
ncbi:MAG TPA: rRNA maturation RNase YbeY [Gammaproteobacteria bacterium]|nr:rRNA maturation RNase YbeY [Gammaproteobacteria bacterium]